VQAPTNVPSRSAAAPAVEPSPTSDRGAAAVAGLLGATGPEPATQSQVPLPINTLVTVRIGDFTVIVPPGCQITSAGLTCAPSAECLVTTPGGPCIQGVTCIVTLTGAPCAPGAQSCTLTSAGLRCGDQCIITSAGANCAQGGVLGNPPISSTPTPTPTATPTPRPTPDATATPEVLPTEVTGQRVSGARGPELPFTGAAVVPPLLLGSVLLAGGLLLRRQTRSRPQGSVAADAPPAGPPTARREPAPTGVTGRSLVVASVLLAAGVLLRRTGRR
jgi:hypothetical protein